MAVSEAALRKNYRGFLDGKLMRIASEDAATLSPEALVVLKEELDKRGLLPSAEKAIEAQRRVFTEIELAAYCESLQTQSCPICQSSAQWLNATMTSRVTSILIITTRTKQLTIACPNCLDKLNSSATNYSLLFGWWGFPWGIIRTTQAIISNGKMSKTNHLPYPNDLLKAFVINNVGRIAATQNITTDLQLLLKTIGRSR